MLALLIGVLFLMICYSLYFQRRARAWTKIPEQTSDYGHTEFNASVIIPFRNEAQHLNELLEALKQQDGITAEFIFVDDHSNDGSERIILQEDDPRFKLLKLTERSGKKAALAYGIEQAKGEIIITTDADCTMGPDWLKQMIKPFSNHELTLVSGPVVFKQQDNFFERWLKLEFISLVATGAASMAMNKPNMCNGANLAYRKSVFQLGFLRTELASGEDVFLMLSLHETKQGSLSFAKHQDAIVYTQAPGGVKEFVQQRIRWASKATAYPSIRLKIEAIFIAGYHMLIIGFGVLTFVHPAYSGLALGMIATKIINDRLFFQRVLPFFKAQHLMKRFFLSELLHLIYIPFFAVLGLFASYRWKERTIRKKN